MKSKEDRLSSYIDSLNNERKPEEGRKYAEDDELQELFDTVRKVKGLKEPVLPPDDYSKTLAANISKKINPRRKWFYGAVSVAAASVAALIITLNFSAPFNKNNTVYAMEQAYKNVKAYHGILEVIETNAEGKSMTQSKVEVWADKEGRYYSKGMEGTQKDLITVNDGKKKWQIQPQEKEVDLFAAFPDPYSFTFDIGKEIEDVKSAVKTKVLGGETLSGRAVTVIEVTPKGGNTYKLWIDKETKMPLQRQSSMEYSLQYKVHYESIDFNEVIPSSILKYDIPQGFKVVTTNTDQTVNTLEEAAKLAVFTPKTVGILPAGYTESSISIINNTKTIKINYVFQDNIRKVSVFEKKATSELKPVPTAILGKIDNNTAEVQSPLEAQLGVLQDSGAYAGITDLSSVRWQQDAIEYAVVGNVSLDELTQFIKGLTTGSIELLPKGQQAVNKAKVEVPVDLKAEEGDQKNADAGHSPWKLDPLFVSQVFVSLKLSPQGITGQYPIKYEQLRLLKNNGKEAVVEVSAANSSVRRVYLERLIRQDSTGIWTVVGYDPAE